MPPATQSLTVTPDPYSLELFSEVAKDITTIAFWILAWGMLS